MRPSDREVVKELFFWQANSNDFYTVGDFMTRKEELHAVKPTTSIDEGKRCGFWRFCMYLLNVLILCCSCQQQFGLWWRKGSLVFL